MTLLAPGLWLQRLTTREPTDDQVEVSIQALAARHGEGGCGDARGAAGSSRASRSWPDAAGSSEKPRSTGRGRRRAGPASFGLRARDRSSFRSTIAARIEVTAGKTSPEELLAAAHATCFVTSLGSELARAGTPPEHMHVHCTITMDEVEGRGHRIVASAHLGTRRGPGRRRRRASRRRPRPPTPVARSRH